MDFFAYENNDCIKEKRKQITKSMYIVPGPFKRVMSLNMSEIGQNHVSNKSQDFFQYF